MSIMKIIACPWCPWTLKTPELSRKAVMVANAHIQYHCDQTIADIESYLETIDDDGE